MFFYLLYRGSKVFFLPKFKLYKDDCLNILNSLPENSVDMIFADPPYFLSSGSFTCQNGQMVSVKREIGT